MRIACLENHDGLMLGIEELAKIVNLPLLSLEKISKEPIDYLLEFQTGILCVNDISKRLKPKTEEKNPELLAEIHDIMEPHSESESHLRTTLLYTNMTAKAVFDVLVEKGWSAESLPTVRTISNILIRQNYRLRTVAKTKVQKKRQKPTLSLKTSGR